MTTQTTNETPGIAAKLGLLLLIPIFFIIGAVEGGCKAVNRLLKDSQDAGI